MKRKKLILTTKQCHLLTVTLFEYRQICNEVHSLSGEKNSGYYIGLEIKKLLASINTQLLKQKAVNAWLKRTTGKKRGKAV